MGSGAFLVEACRQLGDALVQTWHQHDDTPILPPDEDELLHARRLVAQRCLYGVDKNVMAVDLAKLSLWLATLARDHEFTFLDHALRHGDSLLGFSARQIAAFNWEPKAQETLIQERVRADLARAADARRDLLESQDGTPYGLLAQKLGVIESTFLAVARNLGDVLVSAFFAAGKARGRENARLLLLEIVDRAFGNRPNAEAGVQLDQIGAELRERSTPIVPFHWELEFPEVFALDQLLRPSAGFHVIVGNPPFAGKNTLIEGSPDHYLDWLKRLHSESHGNADLVAHFFRRAFDLLRQGGAFGLIATNTIAQGDTRSTGLRWICLNGGIIYRARKRLVWPGEAAVVVSVVHVAKGPMAGPYLLNGNSVGRITAFLFHAGGHADPERLEENAGKSFVGSYILGMGFTFDDTDRSGTASSLAEMRRLIEKDPRNSERIFPYLGGEEINNSPTHSHHRYVINFEDFPVRRKETGHRWSELTEETQRKQEREGIVAPDYPGPVAADWPDLLDIVERTVKPDRDQDNRELYRHDWWKYAEKRPGLTSALLRCSKAYCLSRVSPGLFVGASSAAMVFAESTVVFTDDSLASFACLQSRCHEMWARFMASSMKDDLRYTPSDCFETFPFPENHMFMEGLEEAGSNYYDFRAALMFRNNEGLTKTYNRLHRPDERSPEISELRRLHDLMDRAVLDAYGWRDLRPVPEFFPEFDVPDDEPETSGSRSNRRQPRYRYRWPDEFHDEVLARLLALNAERAALQDPTSGAGRAAKPSVPKRGKVEETSEREPALFD
jgi:hypothetical protein